VKGDSFIVYVALCVSFVFIAVFIFTVFFFYLSGNFFVYPSFILLICLPYLPFIQANDIRRSITAAIVALHSI
jgi:hypothetical protein